MEEHNIILLKTEEARLDQLYHSKCDDKEQMNFTQFLLLILERGIISNKFGIELFYTTFKEAANGEPYLDK